MATANTNHAHRDILSFVFIPFIYLAHFSHFAADTLRFSRDCLRNELHVIKDELRENKRLARCHGARLSEAVGDGVKRTVGLVAREAKGPPTAFPQFARLPAEIRRLIWEEAIPGARAVMLRAPRGSGGKLLGRRCLPGRRDDEKKKKEKGRSLPLAWASSTRVPALLHVNAEARAVALEHYELAFGTAEAGGRVYINFDRDLVALSENEVLPRHEKLWRQTGDASRIRHLAVSHIGRHRHARLPHLRPVLKGVQDVMLVRSVRWHAGRVPGRAARDLTAWAAREKRHHGITQLVGPFHYDDDDEDDDDDDDDEESDDTTTSDEDDEL